MNKVSYRIMQGTMIQAEIYQYIKEFKKSCALPPQLHLENNVANTDNEKAELFNQYFFSVFTKSNFQVPNLDGLNPSPNSLEQCILQNLMCLEPLQTSILIKQLEYISLHLKF